MFVGEFRHSLDDKSRLILPVKFRADFENGGYLAPNIDGCIELWTLGEYHRKSAEYQSRARSGDKNDREISRLWARMSSEAVMDRQGRFLVVGALRQYAQLVDEVIITGNLDHIELWSAAILDERSRIAEEIFLSEGLK